jgi:hypothetical protein
VCQVLYHVVVVVETKMNELDFGENVVAESVVIANYRFEMEVMMDELLMKEYRFIIARNSYCYLALVLMVLWVEEDSNLEENDFLNKNKEK